MLKKITCLIIICFPLYCSANAELVRTVRAQGQLLTEYQQKIIDLQSEVDQLRGQLEENTYQLNQTVERQKMILLQLDDKLSSSKPSASGANKTTLGNWSTSGNDKTDYNFIIKFILDGKEQKESIVAFQQFLKDYPKSTYRDNVNYWLGQLCYGQGRKNDASFYFATVVKDFPNSSKAADSLYKIGLILLENGDKTKAKAVFQQVVSKYASNQNVVSQANAKLATLD